MKPHFFFILLAMVCTVGSAQTNISGVINDYAQVTGVSQNCTCPDTDCSTITLSSSSAFSVGDRVLLIQMKGAIADSSNTPSHGSILDLGDAGNYEFGNISSIAGNVITLEYPLSETYFSNIYPKDSACVQLIRVPVYTGDVNVTGTLEAQPWNGITGGVLAFEVEGTLTLQADISVDGQGYKAARRQQTTQSCSYDTAFYYQSTRFNYSSCSSCDWVYDDSPVRWSELAKYGGCCGGNSCLCQTNRMTNQDFHMAGFRGGGVVPNTFMKRNIGPSPSPYFEPDAIYDKGRGRWGNGGGGGGNHNAGGGGGGNYGAGGFGGNTFNVTGGGSGCDPNILSVERGFGGASLTPGSSRVFMGGGGGEGHDNGGNGSTGTNGGGIIFIRATTIANNASYSITANGNDNNVLAAGDGSGGGGAGGSILIDAGSFPDPITINAKGGKGGDHNNNTCHGTGGGGGGGIVWLSNTTQPANVTTDVSGGMNGIQVAPTFDCDPDTNWGATPGTDGLASFGGSSPFFNTSPCAPNKLLPVALLSFSARFGNGVVYLNWTTESEINNEHFTVERSKDGKSFSTLKKVQASGNALGASYNMVDDRPFNGINYYRLSQTDLNGTREYLQMIKVRVEIPQATWELSPNPARNFVNITLESPRGYVGKVIIYDILGNQVAHKGLALNIGKNDFQINVSGLVNGWYAVRFVGNDGRIQLSSKLFVQ